MSNEQVVEAPEDEREHTAAITVIEPEQTADQMDAVIAISKRIDEYAKAHDAIVGAVVKRSYPGDWVVHKKNGEADENQKANMGAAAAERMAAFVGITESNWTNGGKERSDDQKHYTWTFEADFTFGRRKIHVISRVGTRDKFFGKKDGAWKPLDEVQEDDIKKAAFRACRKEGVRTLLGLRNVPVSKLKELGFDITKINFVGFETGSKELSADEKKASSDGLIDREITVSKCERVEYDGKDQKTGKLTGQKKVFYKIHAADGVIYTLFGDENSRRLIALADRVEDRKPAKIKFKVNSYKGKEGYVLEKVEGVDE